MVQGTCESLHLKVPKFVVHLFKFKGMLQMLSKEKVRDTHLSPSTAITSTEYAFTKEIASITAYLNAIDKVIATTTTNELSKHSVEL